MSVFSEAIGDEQYADEQDESQQDAPHLSVVLHGCHPYLVGNYSAPLDMNPTNVSR